MSSRSRWWGTVGAALLLAFLAGIGIGRQSTPAAAVATLAPVVAPPGVIETVGPPAAGGGGDAGGAAGHPPKAASAQECEAWAVFEGWKPPPRFPEEGPYAAAEVTSFVESLRAKCPAFESRLVDYDCDRYPCVVVIIRRPDDEPRPANLADTLCGVSEGPRLHSIGTSERAEGVAEYYQAIPVGDEMVGIENGVLDRVAAMFDHHDDPAEE